MATSAFLKPINPVVVYSSLKLFRSGPLLEQERSFKASAFVAKFELDQDISPLFPYINAEVESAQLYPTPVYIKFLWKERLCAFYPRQGAFAPARNFGEAVEFLPGLLSFLLDISKRHRQITADHRKYRPASPVDIYRLLPRLNCGKCGYDTCIAFAASLARQQTVFMNCPYLNHPEEENALFPVYDRKGQLLRKVSLSSDTAGLRKNLIQKEAHIKKLQAEIELFRRQKANENDANRSLPTPLTHREIQVLRMLANGDTNNEISRKLNISGHTVKSHTIHIFNKLGVSDRTQAAVWAALNGIL